MATFNQSPAGQTSLAMPANTLGITALLGGTTITGPEFSHDGSGSVVLSLTGDQVPAGPPAGIYPIYRRKTRIISTAIES